MKKIIISTGLLLVFFSSCKTSQINSFSDDIYANPSEEKQVARLAAEEKAKKEAEQKARDEEARLAQKAKDDANPYYQDPKSDADDYYDYKYASRLNRFGDPIPGAGYYDSRYTNYYTYNQNPAMFGSSIYSSYNWMPSSQFGYYSTGIGLSFGNSYGYPSYGSSFYNGYGNPYYSYGYSPFGYGYNPYGYGGFGYYDPFYSAYNSGYYAGYNNGFYNAGGWGYLNSLDVNSGYGHYGPRGSNGGGNRGRSTTAGMNVPTEENERTSFLNSMAEKQANNPRFTETGRVSRGNGSVIYGNDNSQNISPRNGGRNGAIENANPGSTNSINTGRDNTGNASNPRNRGNSKRVYEATPENSQGNSNTNTNSERNSNWGGSNENRSSGSQNEGRSGGSNSSSPRGSGGGGNRPR
jgi:hypothetical protein